MQTTQREINLFSDTVTLPTDEMREAMRNAACGDDVAGEDPTVNRLEEMAAARLGKEAALFVASGTMGNLVSMMTHCVRGDEAILEAESHIYYYEVGGMSAIAGVIPRLVRGFRGIMDPDDVRRAIREPNIHYPRTRVICVENTHNRGGGTVTPIPVMEEICRIAREHGLATHLDGARIFNAAVALSVDPREIARPFDSVMFCLSKGLSAPVGSLICGSRDFIERARKNRKLLGGGMRQAGVIAAAGIVALEKMVDRLHVDHENARLLAEGLSRINGIRVDLESVQTNMVYVDVSGLGFDTESFIRELARRGVKASGRPPYHVRMVTHRHISRENILEVLDIIKEIAASGPGP
ncbi:MAG TPA: low-specificity L-threonine aldolase [Firmicutes bacterium]|nr:low-specificity L-threonine aldolase [Bacillota bacterium]